jgi:hypothetical protein
MPVNQNDTSLWGGGTRSPILKGRDLGLLQTNVPVQQNTFIRLTIPARWILGWDRV